MLLGLALLSLQVEATSLHITADNVTLIKLMHQFYSQKHAFLMNVFLVVFWKIVWTCSRDFCELSLYYFCE